jgi:hypothetical protein
MQVKRPDRQQILDLMNGFRPACVLGAAAELDIWSALGTKAMSAQQLADKQGGNARALTIVLDALVALQLLDKRAGVYSVPPELLTLLTECNNHGVLPMLRHSMNCLRNWSQLAWVSKSGNPSQHQPSILGAEADRASFIAAMHAVSGPMVDTLIARLNPSRFKHLLDVGGASGTWTMAFLRVMAGSTATIFDLPDAIQHARQRFAGTPLASRVSFVEGDFYVNDLPPGADYAWLSAIAHQHSREKNRELYAKVHAALQPGGRIGIRDVVMEADRTRPVDGALFAVNMLVNTDTGGTFTFEEFADDLRAAGFIEPMLRVRDERMNSVVEARKPAAA